MTISAERASQAEAGAQCKGPEVEKCLNAQGQCAGMERVRFKE